MTPDEAKIYLLEDALQQAQHTIEFMHGCLTDPEGYKYAYPSHVLETLKQFHKLAPTRKGCFHSWPEHGCEQCSDSMIHARLKYEAKVTLGLTKNPEKEEQ